MSEDVAFLFLMAKCQEGIGKLQSLQGLDQNTLQMSPYTVRLEGSDIACQPKDFYMTLIDDIVLRPTSVGNSKVLFSLALSDALLNLNSGFSTNPT